MGHFLDLLGLFSAQDKTVCSSEVKIRDSSVPGCMRRVEIGTPGGKPIWTLGMEGLGVGLTCQGRLLMLKTTY